MLPERNGTYETKYSRMDQVKSVEDSLKKTIILQIFSRLSSTNLTCPILEYFAPYICFNKDV